MYDSITETQTDTQSYLFTLIEFIKVWDLNILWTIGCELTASPILLSI